jgi:glycosyltransferase involved in cell wall biosynthesis
MAESTENQPLRVSVIMPLFNAEAYITESLQSILQETRIGLEVLVVDDQSSDRSIERIQALGDGRVRVLSGHREGIAAAFNLALDHAQGDIVVRCDADDRYPPGRIFQQVTWLDAHPNVGAVCGNYLTINPGGKEVMQFQCGATPEDITPELNQGKVRTHFCTFAVRSPVLRHIGGCRPYFEIAEDIDLQLRLGEACSVYYLPDIAYHYRLHDVSITHSMGGDRRQFFDQTARTFHQQRRTHGQDDLQRGNPPIPPDNQAKSGRGANEHMQGLLIGQAWREHQAGRRFKAFSIGLRSAFIHPTDLATWRSVVALLIKSPQS